MNFRRIDQSSLLENLTGSIAIEGYSFSWIIYLWISNK